MADTPFKMKGSPMQRNFGIGSPMTKSTDPKKDLPEDPKKKKQTNTNVDLKAGKDDTERPKITDDSRKKTKFVDANMTNVVASYWADYQKTLPDGHKDKGMPAPKPR